ncbi:MAG TPA: CHAT domain-containing tetratricopeptide repeat protein [Pyrinomonadaceae bacterium]|nr:CHAT domain-containing tetratricopeptide repeat protein [Pyrinomonadaceae bacterium]
MTVLLVLSPVRESAPVVAETAASEELQQITPGTSVSRRIKAGEKETFAVSANENTLLRFSIEKGDLGLTTEVYGPTGVRLLKHVSEQFEIVELSIPADVSGTYKIEIQSREKGNTASDYRLRVDTSNPITLADRKDSEARHIMANAEVLRSMWKEASLRESIGEYDKAAPIWTSLGNFSSASQATLKSGDVTFLLGEAAEALKRYQNAATLAAKGVDRLAEAKALIRIGRLYSYSGKNDLAHKELTRAKNLLGPIDNNTNPIVANALGEALSSLAEVSYATGNVVKTSEQLQQALKLLHDDRKGQAKAHRFAAYIAGSFGVRDKAIAELSETLRLYRETNDKGGEGLALTALGLSHTFQGNQDEAIELHKQAIPIFQQIGDRNSEAIAVNGLGQAHQELKDYSTALFQYRKALQIFHDTGAVDFETVTILTLAKLQSLMGHFDESLESYDRGLQLCRATGKKRTEANALSEMASVYASQHRTGETRELYDRVLKFYERINDRRGQSITLNALGNFLLEIGQKEEAAKTFRRALSLSEQAADAGTIIDTFCNLARAEQALGHLDEAFDLINRSLKKIEKLRADVGSADLRASYFSGVRKNYEVAIDILSDLERVRSGNRFAAEALVMAEQSRARALLDLIRESGADLRQDVSKELINRELELEGMLQRQAQYQMQLKLSGKDSEVVEIENQIVELKSAYQQIKARIRDQNPRALSLSQFQPLSLADIQKELRQDDVLLEISLGDERSHLWMVTSNSFQHFQLPSRHVIEERATELYRLVTDRKPESEKLFLQKALPLSQMLFEQVATQLGSKRLLLVTEGALQLVPYAALPDPSAPLDSNALPKYLIRDHEIVQLPSIATLRAIRAAEKKHRDAADKIAAVLADPVFTIKDARVKNSSLAPAVANAATDEDQPESAQRAVENLASGGPARLTHSSEEADAIAKAAPRGTTLVAKGFDATRETALNAHLGEYQIVHFATHGFLDSDHPELSSIVLSMVDKNGDGKNGVMPLHDIYNMDLSAELTVLSACQTALGKDIRGEGFVGLTHSFISAGSRSVIASLWKVDDRATAALMEDLYQSMLQKGMSPAAALRAANLKLMQDKRWSAPYYWAGFVVQGEYTNHITVENNSRRNLGVIALLSLLLISCGLIAFKTIATKRQKLN